MGANLFPTKRSMGTTARRKHHSLTGRITIELLAKAFKRVKRNKGAAGVDRVSVEQYEKNLGMNLAELMRLLKQRHRYHPKPNRRVWIPKSISRRKDAPKRPLGIPGVRDRVAQEVVRQLLEPIFEPKFHPHSCGFRPNRGCHTAIQLLLKAKKMGLRYVVDADITGFFDNLPHDVTMKAVCEEVADGNILEIIRKFLGAGVMEDGKVIDTTRGTPQGGVVSPLLANIVLNRLDWALDGAGFFFVRYADDFVVLCRTPQQAEKALALVRAILKEIGLALSEEKTKITSFNEHFDFLGFTFKSNALAIRHKAVEKFKENVRNITRRNNGKNLNQTIAELNPLLRGTVNYYAQPYTHVRQTMRNWDKWVRHRLRYHKHKRTRLGFQQRRRTSNRWFERKGLVSMFELACQRT
jgi:group II intron reverse transcriptase/maturase